MSCSLFAAALLLGLHAPADDPLDQLEKFITSYHREPNPKQVPAMVRVALKSDAVQSFTAKDPPHVSLLLAHAFGQMARRSPTLVRVYESEFAGATKHGRLWLLACLQVCGDKETIQQIEKWRDDRKYLAVQDALKMAHAFLSDPKRKLPRDRAARVPTDLDLLWGDFLVTGEYTPVARILDTFDQDPLRRRIETFLKGNPDKRRKLLKALDELHLVKPKAKDQLIDDDLVLTLLDRKGGEFEKKVPEVIRKLQGTLKLSEEEWVHLFLLKASAMWSMQSNMEQHPKLRELLKEHVKERPRTSRLLIEKWLAKKPKAKE
jgi:hypothetical protein